MANFQRSLQQVVGLDSEIVLLPAAMRYHAYRLSYAIPAMVRGARQRKRVLTPVLIAVC